MWVSPTTSNGVADPEHKLIPGPRILLTFYCVLNLIGYKNMPLVAKIFVIAMSFIFYDED